MNKTPDYSMGTHTPALTGQLWTQRVFLLEQQLKNWLVLAPGYHRLCLSQALLGSRRLPRLEGLFFPISVSQCSQGYGEQQNANADREGEPRSSNMSLSSEPLVQAREQRAEGPGTVSSVKQAEEVRTAGGRTVGALHTSALGSAWLHPPSACFRDSAPWIPSTVSPQ